MLKITTAADLKSTISTLEHKQNYERVALKQQLLDIYEGLKPINLIKDTVKGLYENTDLKANTANTALGIATGFIAKKILLGNTHNPFTKLVGFIIETVVINKVAKNADGIKSISNNILKKIINQNHTAEKD